MSKIRRKYLVARDKVKREEIRTPVHRTPIRNEKDEEFGDYVNKGQEEIEDEIVKLYKLREGKHKGKDLSDLNKQPFGQLVFRRGNDDDVAAESPRMGEKRNHTKIAAGSRPKDDLCDQHEAEEKVRRLSIYGLVLSNSVRRVDTAADDFCATAAAILLLSSAGNRCSPFDYSYRLIDHLDRRHGGLRICSRVGVG
ncbi:hypothetical protein CBR_g4492 [Chara braunii]|uniref:Uncharacterized protein n=1 Tax=Chara braunii TaxID=69332 RepID=A0A388KHZ1_CHABU|nr:hypothetical protein CBR_g4492 [Chara braunii]|eukprot:GBG69662.1 hypothetical protein CBR_g4492 [Chara braunii]